MPSQLLVALTVLVVAWVGWWLFGPAIDIRKLFRPKRTPEAIRKAFDLAAKDRSFKVPSKPVSNIGPSESGIKAMGKFQTIHKLPNETK